MLGNNCTQFSEPGACVGDQEQTEKVGRSQSGRTMGIFLDSILWVKREGCSDMSFGKSMLMQRMG